MASKKETKNLTAIVIAKNEEEMLGDCLLSLEFADEVIVVDNLSTDKTAEIAKTAEARVIQSAGSNYSQFRNDGLAAATGKWILYVDADERVTPLLRQEIASVIESNPNGVFDIPRKNIYLGREMQYGGWGVDYVTRLFHRDNIKTWHKPLHEEAEFTGEPVKLANHLVHFSHRDLSSMLKKTLFFTGFESKLRFDSAHPPVVTWRFVRVMFTEFWKRFVRLEAANDGAEGIIDGMFQVFNMFVIYARLWEMQNASQPRRTK